jgi:D-alanyl-D-alanine carboxypeptidase
MKFLTSLQPLLVIQNCPLSIFQMKPIKLILSIILIGIYLNSVKAQNLNQVLRSELSSTNPGILFSIESGDKQISWSGAAGINDLFIGDSLQVRRTFRIAIVTITSVAAAILRLMEK